MVLGEADAPALSNPPRNRHSGHKPLGASAGSGAPPLGQVLVMAFMVASLARDVQASASGAGGNSMIGEAARPFSPAPSSGPAARSGGGGITICCWQPGHLIRRPASRSSHWSRWRQFRPEFEIARGTQRLMFILSVT